MNRDLRRDPSCGLCASIDTADSIWSNELWLVRPIDPPLGVAGWMLLVSRRHCPGPERIRVAYAEALRRDTSFPA